MINVENVLDIQVSVQGVMNTKKTIEIWKWGERMKTKNEEIKELIRKIEMDEFLLQMKDFWNSSDFARSRENTRKIRELKAKLDNE